MFRTTVQKDPADLQPFTLDVDSKEWEQYRNRTYPRKMDQERKTALQEMLKVLIKNKVVEPCEDMYYSHAFLVPKPNGKWRLVLDFKNLNKATLIIPSWQIPNIKEMLQNIGNHKPKYFAVFDLTSGYYQCPIDSLSLIHI